MRNSFSLDQNKNHIDVLFSFNGRDQYARPVRLTWNETEYYLGGVQFWYSEHKGNVLVHHYRISDAEGDYTFELSLETENLIWSLERVTENRAHSTMLGLGQQFVGATS